MPPMDLSACHRRSFHDIPDGSYSSVLFVDAYSAPVPGADDTAITETSPTNTTPAGLAQAPVAQVTWFTCSSSGCITASHHP